MAPKYGVYFGGKLHYSSTDYASAEGSAKFYMLKGESVWLAKVGSFVLA